MRLDHFIRLLTRGVPLLTSAQLARVVGEVDALLSGGLHELIGKLPDESDADVLHFLGLTQRDEKKNRNDQQR